MYPYDYDGEPASSCVGELEDVGHENITIRSHFQSMIGRTVSKNIRKILGIADVSVLLSRLLLPHWPVVSVVISVACHPT